jgi:anti-sigma B factor antagonist
MQIDIRDEAGVVLIDPAGDIDGKSAPEFHQAASNLIKPQARIVLNLGRVAFMSSAGLRSMLLVYQQAKEKDAKVVLTGVNGDILKSMSATGFLRFFVVADTVQDAISKVG